MNWFKRCWLHFKNVCIHKWWVFFYSCYFHIPVRGFFHDWSKFTPVEFFESVKFFKGDSSPINEAKAVNGISFAWQHHKGRNPHHYEYWTDCYDTGTVARQMPWKYVIELVCDYLAAGRTYNDYNMFEKFTFQKELDWWNKVCDEKCMHEETKRAVTIILEMLAQHGLRMWTGRNTFGEKDYSTYSRLQTIKDLMFSSYDYQQKHQNWKKDLVENNMWMGQKLEPVETEETEKANEQ